MKWNLKDLKNLLSNVKRHKVQQIRITDNQFELFINTLQKKVMGFSLPSNDFKEFQHMSNTTTKESYTSLSNNQEGENIQNNPKYWTIVSPMVGTFYRASSPEEHPFINILDQVTYNQTVCIIEAMKLMNEIEAEVDGKIIDILVKDSEFVDCGQPLMIVEPIANTRLES